VSLNSTSKASIPINYDAAASPIKDFFKNAEGESRNKQWLDVTQPFVKSWFVIPNSRNFDKLYAAINEDLVKGETYNFEIKNAWPAY
jgi:hypothetical protein